MYPDAYFFGVTRFSVYSPNSAAWNISSRSEKEYLSNLYSDDRLASRFEIFTSYALPIYKKYSEEYKYKHILTYSDEMPDKWKFRLYNLADSHPFLILNEAKSLSYKKIIENCLRLDSSQNCPVAVFRVDDDDVLSEFYIDELSKYVDYPFVGMSVSFGAGIAARYSSGNYIDFRRVKKPLIAIGLASIGEYRENDEGLMLPESVSHPITDNFRPVIVDSQRLMFVWTHHDSQDSNYGSRGKGIDSAFWLYQSLSNPKELAGFPTIKSDFELVSDKLLLLKKIDETEYGNTEKKLSAGKISGPGQYRFVLKCTFKNKNLNDNKGIIFYLKKGEGQIGEVHGLRLSNSEKIGFYRYISVKKGEASATIDIFLSEESDIEKFFVKGWGLKDDFSLLSACIFKIDC